MRFRLLVVATIIWFITVWEDIVGFQRVCVSALFSVWLRQWRCCGGGGSCSSHRCWGVMHIRLLLGPQCGAQGGHERRSGCRDPCGNGCCSTGTLRHCWSIHLEIRVMISCVVCGSMVRGTGQCHHYPRTHHRPAILQRKNLSNGVNAACLLIEHLRVRPLVILRVRTCAVELTASGKTTILNSRCRRCLNHHIRGH